jgi:hypothetical protein
MDNRDLDMGFRKSSICGVGGCVEVAFVDDREVWVRDSKNPHGPHLSFTGREWAAFVAGVRLGEFELIGSSTPSA